MSEDYYKFLDGRDEIKWVACFNGPFGTDEFDKGIRIIHEKANNKCYHVTNVNRANHLRHPEDGYLIDNTRHNKAIITFKKIK